MEQPSPLSSYVSSYEWIGPQQRFIFSLQMDVIDRLGAEIMRGFGRVPRRGAEVGGLLLGHREPGRIEITGFEPIPTEYQRGPSYLLSPSDRARFLQTVQRFAHPPGGQPALVGFYRSHTRDGFGLGEEDIALLERFPATPFDAVLLVRPYATRLPEAGFLYRDDGRLPALAPAALFPFHRRSLGGGPSPSRRRHEEPAAGAMKDDSAPPAAVATVPRAVSAAASLGHATAGTRTPPLLGLLLAGVLCGGLGLLGGYQWAVSAALSAQSAPVPALAVNVKPASQGVVVSWDRSVPLLRKAERGTLTFLDGPYASTVPLTAAQLTNATIAYQPRTPAVEVRLDVLLHGRTGVAESTTWRSSER